MLVREGSLLAGSVRGVYILVENSAFLYTTSAGITYDK